MAGSEQAHQLDSFLTALASSRPARVAVKVVLFDEPDLDWAEELALRTRHLPLYLSAGTDVNMPEPETIVRLRERYRWLCENVSTRAAFSSARLLPQLHVVAWGTQRGV